MFWKKTVGFTFRIKEKEDGSRRQPQNSLPGELQISVLI
jgi:hypothetical protein